MFLMNREFRWKTRALSESKRIAGKTWSYVRQERKGKP